MTFVRHASVFVFLTTTTCVADVLAADPVTELADDGQVWGAITATGSLAGLGPAWRNLRFWLDGQGRFGNDMSSLSQGQIRPGIGYALSDKATAYFGYVYTYTDTPFASRPFDEHRVWQQLVWTQPVGSTTMTSRTRFEQRRTNIGDDTGLRFRQMFKFSWPIPGLSQVSLVTSDEVFVNFNNVDWGPRSGLDQNRAFAGFGYTFNKTFRTEIGYLNQFINRPTSPDRMTHILALSLFINWPSP